MNKKHAILLVRVSVDTQFYESQIYDLENYAKNNGYSEFKVFASKETGFADFENKIGTNEMFKFIDENPEYNCIFITELSRIGRRQTILHQVKDILVRKKIQLFVKDSDYKLFNEDFKITPQGEVMFTLYGLFAEQEMKQKFERFSRKKRELMKDGYSISGKVLFGYKRELDNEKKKNKLVLHEDNAQIVKNIFNWYLYGIEAVHKNPSIKRISIHCIKEGYPKYTHSKRNVNKLLKEEAYIGFKITNNKRKNPKYGINNIENETPYIVSNFEIKYKPIIDKETFDLVQLKLKSNIINGDKETKYVTILSKLILCPSCGRKLAANYRNRLGVSNNSYRCTSRGDNNVCYNTKSLSMNLIDSSVWSLIKSDLVNLSKKINEINPNIELKAIENQLINLQNKIEEIESDEKLNYTRLNNIKRNKNLNLLEYESNIFNELNNLDKEKTKILNEILKLESSKSLIDSRIKDLETIINQNLPNIESSKELLKKYINSFVEVIKIIRQDKRFTVLEVFLKDLSISELYEKSTLFSPITKQSYFLIIDKKVTRDIKLYITKLNYTDKVSNSTDNTFESLLLPLAFNEIENQTFAKSIDFEEKAIYTPYDEPSSNHVCSLILYKKLNL
jgi:site-specific DNA recombinase